MKGLRRLRGWAAAALAGACAAAAQTGKFYSGFLPDTLLPYESYDNIRVPGPITAVKRWPDTVDLKRGATLMRMIGTRLNENGDAEYSIVHGVPRDAEAGSYNAYSPRGTLLESDVAFVPDVRGMTPRLYPVRANGLRGRSYLISGIARGLPFGPIPWSYDSAFVPRVRYFALARGTDTIPLENPAPPEFVAGGVILSPYRYSARVDIPYSASFGPYRLVTEREDGVRTFADSAFEVFPAPAPANVSVAPDSLLPGAMATLGITGQNLDYAVLSGSDVVLDRRAVPEVHLRHGGTILPASDYPKLGTTYSPRNPIAGNILARFEVPPEFPAGPCDLGIVLAARGDTAYFPGILRIAEGRSIALAPSAGAGDGNRVRRSGNGLDLILAEPASVEARSLSGRVLVRTRLLRAGRHELALPPSARGEAILLCRLQGNAKATWLKIARAP